jgi:hypothetical protein
MTLQQLGQLCDDLLVSECDASPMLSAFTDAELLDAYSFVLLQYGLELVCGAYEKSGWINGQLLICANEGPVLACQTAFAAIRLEMGRRKLAPPFTAK